MLLKVYIPQFMAALFGGLFIFVGILSFGKANFFDHLFIGIIIFTGIICRKNINVVSLLAIILLQIIVQELAWVVLTDSSLLKISLYSIVLILMYSLRFDEIIKWIAPLLLLAIASEIYWYVADYSAPQLNWYLILLISCLITRYMIFSRVEFIDSYFPKQGQSTNLDWIFYKLMGITAFVHALMILEYLIRHILGQDQILLVYYSYPYIIHIVAIFSIWATFHESYKALLPKLLKA